MDGEQRPEKGDMVGSGWPRGEEKSTQTYPQALKVQLVARIKTRNGDQ